ncbi:toll/interleukin-1 receptor (TIR) domain-containing protein [Artemisia annua]|uniref:Toll/interleukin-1 receptor (TIR) domain-containing protein n=1 Tax=Artemisia annua TaxID=35608 RepID=A0A2U1Q9T1_ARTAN|nr:toll/interleukin-1 receptor (TIR) domain-containing protein [Artemisia annua]
MASSSSSSSSQSRNYDVFLSFRGEDTRYNFVKNLHSALLQRRIYTYKDAIRNYNGDDIGPSFSKAIEESRIAVIVFSKNYAESSFCLDELTHIMKCKLELGQTVIPIFYGVDPSDVRRQKGEFGQGFAKHQKTSRAKPWRRALIDASMLSRFELQNVASGHEAMVIKNVVDSISESLLSMNSYVGMETRLQDFKSHIEIGSGGVRMVWIWGVGGSGKTTLASCVFKEISPHFENHCFVDNIREESNKINGLQNLQKIVLATLLETQTRVEVKSVEEGKSMIQNSLCRKNVLIVLDDVDNHEQLEALAGSHKWFGGGSRIIITTRNEQLLRNHKVDEISRVSLLSNDEALQLFNRHAYPGYLSYDEDLSRRAVSYTGGLPLALKVLGSFLNKKFGYEWMSTFDRLGDNSEIGILEILKMSYDGLEPVEKELFLDIACFFRGKSKDSAMQMLDACGFHPAVGVTVLTDMALITIKGDKFDMHDLVQEMGHNIVQSEDPNNPNKRSRVWRTEEIEEFSHAEAIMNYDKIEAIQVSSNSPDVPKLVSNMKRLRFLDVHDYSCDHHLSHKDIEGPHFLSNESRCISWVNHPESPLPDNFQPEMLVLLKLHQSLQEKIWKSYKFMPSLKVLDLHGSNNLIRTPDFAGLPNLETLELSDCTSLIEIHPSIECHPKLVCLNLDGCCKLQVFPTFDRMKMLETLILCHCPQLLNLPEIQQHVACLKYLYLDESGIEVLPSSVGKYCTNLSFISLFGCKNFKRIECNFTLFKKKCVISGGGPLKS